MAAYIKRIRTESGDLQIDYNALANLPDLKHTHTPSSIGAAEAEHTHERSDIIGFPTSLPANGGNADTVDNMHASDFATASDVEQLKTKVDSISLDAMGVTATITELNYMSGVTSDVQSQLNAKAESVHDHSASEITSGVFDADRLPMIVMNKGGTGAEDGATGLQNLFASGNTILSAYQFGDELPEPGNEGRIFFKKVSG